LKDLTNYDKVRQFHKAFGHPLDKELSLGHWSLIQNTKEQALECAFLEKSLTKL
jgi:hypothetical protein